MPPKERPPFLGLLLRATAWTPIAILISFVMLISALAVVFLPIIAAIYLYIGNRQTAGIYCIAAVISFFIARPLIKRFWETPDSLL